MKDITIKGKSIKRELWILLGCFVFAVCVNIFAIIKYSRPAKELFTMIGYVIIVAIITYIVLWAIRLIVLLIVWIIRKLSKRG
ncbi:MAG: hypothetical protein LKJ95_03745 [Bacteroidales bacterium]|jgi:uncharacterized membrane protein|nr:hypothetical protein [Bacteroidales bacterium]